MNSTPPLTMRKKAATAGAPKSAFSGFSSAKPKITAGIVAMMIIQSSRHCARRSSPGPTPMKASRMPTQSRQK